MHVYRRSHSFVTANCFKTTVFFPHFIVLCVRISFRSLFYQPLKIISKICAAIFVICSFYMCIYFQLKIEHLIVFFSLHWHLLFCNWYPQISIIQYALYLCYNVGDVDWLKTYPFLDRVHHCTYLETILNFIFSFFYYSGQFCSLRCMAFGQIGDEFDNSNIERK